MVTLRKGVVEDRFMVGMDDDEFDLGTTVDVDEIVVLLWTTDCWTDDAATDDDDDDDDNDESVVSSGSFEIIVLLFESLSYGEVDTLWMFHGAECPSITKQITQNTDYTKIAVSMGEWLRPL